LKTSATHPLEIATIELGHGHGSLGVTFCPGKKQLKSTTGPWDRDLEADLDNIVEWNAAVVLTLVEQFELNNLAVSHLGQRVIDKHMEWFHLPIVDVSVPDAEFEEAWSTSGESIRSTLRSGFNVLVHCRGGIGRAGTIAARLMVELGFDPELAMDRVRSVRPGAIETREQEDHVRSVVRVPEASVSQHSYAQRDRAVGALIGLAVGDAIGTTLEFAPRNDRASRLTDMEGGGPFALKAGQWTDDTSLAWALADSLLSTQTFDPNDLADRFVSWWRDGTYSSNGRCFDIGITTRHALKQYELSGKAFSGPVDLSTAGNGSLMRVSPVAIRYWNDKDALAQVAADQSRVTHGAPEAVEACVLFCEILADAIAGKARTEVLRARTGTYTSTVGKIASGSWKAKHRSDIRGSGYVLDALEASLWCVGRTTSFASAVLMAANLRDDADTTAAITGQLAGALYGNAAIPVRWRNLIVQYPDLHAAAERLFENSQKRE
jgi:ADP-ribosyl-[dinitrogen reductase] hydrolase